MNDNKFLASTSPHVSASTSTKKIMLDVIISLLPCFIAGIIFFGIEAVVIVLLAVFSAVASEVIFNLCKKYSFKDAINIDLTSVVTGLLIGLSLNAKSAWYIPVFASVFAIIVVKMLFGGTGRNIVNPAIAGRCFVFISFLGNANSNMATNWVTTDGIITGATPLTDVLTGALATMDFNPIDLLLGINVAGCIGETCKLAVVIGFIYLVIRKVINFKWPLIYILTAGLFTVALEGFDFAYFLPTILMGSLMFVAVYMSTDYVTTPNTMWGNVIYFVLLGLLTAGLRIACKMEVVTFVILLMNFVVPFLDKLIIPKPFGTPKKIKQQKEAN